MVQWLGEDRRTPWIILGLGLAVRIGYLLQIQTSPLFAHPEVDALTYAEQAARLAQGNWLGQGEGPFWQPPLYPYFLGAIRAVSPGSFFFTARLVQVLLGVFSCAFVYHLGKRFFHPAVGSLAMLATALYGPLIFFDGELLPASVAVLLNLIGLTLLARALEKPSSKSLLAAGMAFGVAAIAVPTALLFVLAASGWIWRRLRRQRGLRLAASFVLGTALAIAPVSLRNLLVGGDWVLISYNAGINFFIGNNPDYPATLQLRPGWEWDDLTARPRKEGIDRPSARSAYFFARSWEFIRRQPHSYLRLLLHKTAAFWNGDEVGRNLPLYYWRNYSSVLSLLLWKRGVAFPFGLVAPLAIWGLLLYLRRQGLALPALFAIVYSLGVILFFVSARHRLPVIPVLLLFAAHGIHALYLDWKRKDYRSAGWGLAVCLLFAVPANWRISAMDMEGDASIHYHLGNAYIRQGESELARQRLARVVELDPEYWQAWANLGIVHAMQGDRVRARELFAMVSSVETERLDVWVNLAHASMFVGHPREVLEAYWQALRVNPYQRQLYVEVLTLLLKAGDEANAQRVLRQAIAYHPGEAVQLRQLYRRLKAQAEKARAQLY